MASNSIRANTTRKITEMTEAEQRGAAVRETRGGFREGER